MPERLYRAEPFLSSFQATATDIREISREQGRSLWQIALDRTAFYPTGGGQPCDAGALTAISPGGARLEVPVLEVEEDECGEIWHTTRKPLLAGTVVQGRIDWSRRLDHMQQHSGQHLLSAIFRRDLAAPTLSFHLGDAASTVDLGIDRRGISGEQLRAVEVEANRVIAENRPVSARTVPRSEAELLLASGALSKLPDRDGPIRLIEIENLDVNACGGVHVCATGQIGGLTIRGVESVRQGLRVEFFCGLRMIAAARRDFEDLGRAAGALSVGRAQTPEAVERLRNENRALQKEGQRLLGELVEFRAARLAEEPLVNGLRLVRRIFSGENAAGLKLLASRLIATAPRTCALLASTAEAPARLVMARSPGLDIDCGAMLRRALEADGARGGGSPEIAQGQIAADRLEALLDRVTAQIYKEQSGW